MIEDNGDPYNPASRAYVGSAAAEAEAREEGLMEAARLYADARRNEGALGCECGGTIEFDKGTPDTRQEPGTPPCWHCAECGLDFDHHPAIERAFLTGARFVEAGYKLG